MKKICTAIITLLLALNAHSSDGYCPSNIISTQLGFYVFQFDLTVCEASTQVTWDLGGGFLESTDECTMISSFFSTGSYTITATFTDEDCEGNGTSEVSITIYVSGPPPCSQNAIDIEQIDYNTFSFSLPSWVECNEWQVIFWGIYDEFGTTIFTNTSDCAVLVDFAEGGSYSYITELMATAFCDSGEFIVEEFGDGICPDEIIAIPITDYVEFYIPGLQEGIPVTWNFGDGTVLVDDWYTQHLYECEQFCSYTVTASFVDPDCPLGGGDGTIITFFFDFDSPYYCPEGIVVNEIYCNTFEFGYDPSPYVDDIYWAGTWYVNGNYYAQDFSYLPGMLQIEFDEPGIYEISLELYCYGSYQLYTLNTEIEVVENCDAFCPENISATEFACHEFIFLADLPISDDSFEWQFGDGSIQDWNGLVTHTYAATGEYEVCLNILSGACSPSTICTSAFVDDCFIEGGPCPEVTALNLGCGLYHFEFEEGNTPYSTQISIGNDSFTVETYSFDYAFTSANMYFVNFEFIGLDCSQTIIINDIGFCDCLVGHEVSGSCSPINITLDIPQNSVVHWVVDDVNFYGDESEIFEFTEPGVHELCIHYQNESCDMSEYYCFNVYSETCLGICPDSIITTQLSTNTSEFFIEGIDDGQPVTWNFGDGNEVVDDETIQHEFEPGAYNVTAIFMDADCPWDGPTVLSTTVNIFECFLELSATQGENGLFTFVALGSPEVYPMLWDFGDGTSMEATWAVDHSYEPGAFTICASIVSELCADTVSACIEIELEEIICPDTILFTPCIFTVLGLPTGTLGDWTFSDTFYENQPTSINHQWSGLTESEQIVCFWNDSLENAGCPAVCNTIDISGCINSIAEPQTPFFYLSPNPATDQFSIETTFTETLSIALFNSVGKKVMATKLSTERNVDVSTLSVGLYILQVEMGVETFYQRIEIVR